MEHLTGHDPVVVHDGIENHSSEVPRRGIEMPELILQFDSARVIDAPGARRGARWRATASSRSRRHEPAGPPGLGSLGRQDGSIRAE